MEPPGQVRQQHQAQEQAALPRAWHRYKFWVTGNVAMLLEQPRNSHVTLDQHVVTRPWAWVLIKGCKYKSRWKTAFLIPGAAGNLTTCDRARR